MGCSFSALGRSTPRSTCMLTKLVSKSQGTRRSCAYSRGQTPACCRDSALLSLSSRLDHIWVTDRFRKLKLTVLQVYSLHHQWVSIPRCDTADHLLLSIHILHLFQSHVPMFEEALRWLSLLLPGHVYLRAFRFVVFSGSALGVLLGLVAIVFGQTAILTRTHDISIHKILAFA